MQFRFFDVTNRLLALFLSFILQKLVFFGFFSENNIFFVKFAGVDPEVLGIDRQRSQSGQRVPSNSFSSFSDFDDNDFASFDEPILVPAVIPARPKPIEKINTNR